MSNRDLADSASAFIPNSIEFSFDFSPVMKHCDSLRRHPERVMLMCQNQVRSIAPDELVIPHSKGFSLIVQTRTGLAAEILASDVHLALLQRLFGTKSPPDIEPIFRAVPRRGRRLSASNRMTAPSVPMAPVEDRRKAKTPARTTPSMSFGDAVFKPGLVPMVNLQHEGPPIYLCGPTSVRDGRSLFGADALRYCHEQYRPSVDIAMLEFSLRLASSRAPGRFAIATAVSYETLAWSRSRQLYQDAFQGRNASDNSNIVIMIDDVPNGIPASRMAEIAASLRPVARRIFAQLPDRDCNLAASCSVGLTGLCAALPARMTAPQTAQIAGRLKQAAAVQHAVSCIIGAEGSSTIGQLRCAGIHFAARRPDDDDDEVVWENLPCGARSVPHAA
jgi:hypothetical protein